MKNQMYKATRLIQETFDEKGIDYHVETAGEAEMVCAGFTIDEGPFVVARFVSCDNDNDVSLRVIGFINRVKEEKRARVREACNALNKKRHVKFYVDEDGDVNAVYDFPCCLSDDCVGEVAYEMYCRLRGILKRHYTLFMRAMYTTESLTTEGESSLRGLLSQLSDFESPLEILHGMKELHDRLARTHQVDNVSEEDTNSEFTESQIGETDDVSHEDMFSSEITPQIGDEDECST